MPELRSRTVTHGRNMAGARALMRASGVPGADIGRKPIIAVANVFLSLLLLGEVPNAALPEREQLADVGDGTMVSVAKAQVSDETHPHIHVRRSLRPDGQEQFEMVVDELVGEPEGEP